jgi:hypothetical protein
LKTFVTKPAAAILRASGGEMYVWHEPSGRGAVERAAIQRPIGDDLAFAPYDLEGDLRVFIDQTWQPECARISSRCRR